MANWPDPLPLENDLPAVEVCDESFLPESLKPFVVDTAERMQVSLDVPAAVCMITLAGVVNRRARIQPKQKDTEWQVTPNLWGAIIAPPGYMKTPVIQAITRPLTEIEKQWQKDKRGTSKRLIVNDATPEKLHEIMRDNPSGVFIIRDELSGWLADLDKKGREGERAFHLTAWNGDSSYTVDRIERGSTFVEGCCESILGGIQPEKLKQYLRSSQKIQDDGLLQRFQFSVWPDIDPNWRYVDEAPNRKASTVVKEVFGGLAKLDSSKPVLYVFAPEAQEFFAWWLGELETSLRNNSLPSILVSHFAKYRSLLPSLALLCQLADDMATGSAGFDGSDGIHPRISYQVSLEQLVKAHKWCEYLQSHARRIYSCVQPELNSARTLLQKIKEHQLGKQKPFTARDVYVKGWRGLNSPEAMQMAIDPLVRAHWIKENTAQSGKQRGRPSTQFIVNPKVWTGTATL